MTEPSHLPEREEPAARRQDSFRGESHFRLVVEYDGTRYAGWQRQPDAPTIQQALEEALGRIVGAPVRCQGAGRTDAGVHALGQVARLTVPRPFDQTLALVRGGNACLPPDIRILSAHPCDPTFDPRRDARRRWYRYSILTRPAPPALDRARLLHVSWPLDWPAIEAGLDLLRGEHDFRAFRSSACRAARTRLSLETAQHVDDHPVHHLDFACRSFLHNMVRLMTGLLLEIGRGRHSPEIVHEMLQTGRRPAAFACAPPHGLVLMEVEY